MILHFLLGLKTWWLVGEWYVGHPTDRCHCGWPTLPRDTGDIIQWECPFGRCGHSKYEKKP